MKYTNSASSMEMKASFDRLHENDKKTANIKYTGGNKERFKRIGENSMLRKILKRLLILK